MPFQLDKYVLMGSDIENVGNTIRYDDITKSVKKSNIES